MECSAKLDKHGKEAGYLNISLAEALLGSGTSNCSVRPYEERKFYYSVYLCPKSSGPLTPVLVVLSILVSFR